MHRRALFLVTAIIFGSFFIWRIAVVQAKVLVGAVAPQITVAENEYVELYNDSSSSAQLSDWSLKKVASTGATSMLVSDFGPVSIAPFGYFLVAHENYVPVNTVVADKIYSANSNNLSPNNNGVILLDDVGQLVDAVYWGNVSSSASVLPAANVGEGKSLVRKPDDDVGGNSIDTDDCAVDFFETNLVPRNSLSAARPFLAPVVEVTSTPTTTPDENISTSSLWTMLRINEFVSDPNDGDEWVELYNPSTSSLDLVGGSLCDDHGVSASSTACKALSGVISPLDFFVFSWSGYLLNNDVDSVILKNPSGEIVDRVDYDGSNAPSKNESLARDPLTGEWKVSTHITSAAANVIVPPVVYSGSSGGSSYSDSVVETKIVTTSTKVTSTKESVVKKEVGIVWKITQPKRVIVGSSTIFDSTGTLDARGGKFVYLWDFGEGQAVDGSPARFTFVSSGIHLVTVFATSSAGSVGSKQIKIMVWPTSTVASAVVIDAVLPNEKGVDDEEYVKIKNTGTSSVDISRWKVLYNDEVYQIPVSTTIAGGDELIFYKAITKFSLNNLGGTLELRDDKDFLIDVLEYGKTMEGKEVSGGSASSSLAKSVNTAPVKKTSNSKTGVYLGMVTLLQAREANDGTVVRVRGVVTVLPGVFGTQYFYIADKESGLQVYQSKKDFPELEVGDNVEVFGTLGTAYGEKRLKVRVKTDIDILSTTNVVVPVPLEISEIDASNLGALIKIRGEITEIKSNFMYVDDGAAEVVVYFKKGAQVDKKKFVEGENVEVVGILTRASTGLQIWPRMQSDIVSVGASEYLNKKQELVLADENKSKSVAENYLTTTAGGITALLLAFLARARGTLIASGAKKVAQVVGKFFGRG